MGAIERLGLTLGCDADSSVSPRQAQTQQAFGFKWSRRDTYESDAMRSTARQWLIERYCGGDERVVAKWLGGDRKLILDAGCGAAFSALLLFDGALCDHDYLGIDISDAVNVARERFRQAELPGDFLQVGLFEAQGRNVTVDMEDLIAELREEAAEIGCDGVVLTGTRNQVVSGSTSKGYAATCIVFRGDTSATTQAAAGAPATP